MPLTAAAVDRFDRRYPNRTSTPNRARRRVALQRLCRVMTGASPATGRRTMSGVPRRSEWKDSAVLDYLARMTKEQEDR
jgi:hypothetical protein